MTGADRRVWMQLEGIRARFFELVGVVACGVQLPEQSGSLLSEGRLGLGELVEVVAAKNLVEPFGFTLNTADAPACLSRDCTRLRGNFAATAGVGAAARMLRAPLEHRSSRPALVQVSRSRAVAGSVVDGPSVNGAESPASVNKRSRAALRRAYGQAVRPLPPRRRTSNTSGTTSRPTRPAGAPTMVGSTARTSERSTTPPEPGADREDHRGGSIAESGFYCGGSSSKIILLPPGRRRGSARSRRARAVAACGRHFPAGPYGSSGTGVPGAASGAVEEAGAVVVRHCSASVVSTARRTPCSPRCRSPMSRRNRLPGRQRFRRSRRSEPPRGVRRPR